MSSRVIKIQQPLLLCAIHMYPYPTMCEKSKMRPHPDLILLVLCPWWACLNRLLELNVAEPLEKADEEVSCLIVGELLSEADTWSSVERQEDLNKF